MLATLARKLIAAVAPNCRLASPLVLLCCLAALRVASAAPDPQTTGTPTPVAATTEQPAEVEEVVITGSRIAMPNMTSISPIQIVTSEELKLQGVTDISDLVNRLPQNFQNSVADFSNTTNPLTSAGGISTIDLRGLGPQRTLVLVDGRRLGVGDASTLNPNPAPDINQIPAQLVERIDVVTGGASAVYGSDAIAGVVNFIMRHDFEGIQIDGQYGIDQHSNHNSLMQGLETQAGFNSPTGSVWDGQNRSLSVIMGTNFADHKGNITAYFTYHDQDPISEGARDFSACKLNVDPSSNPKIIDTPSCNGSPNSNLFEPTFNPNGIAYSVVGNQLLPYPQAGSVPPALFNSSPYQFLSRQDTRYLAGFFSQYDLNEYVKPYVDFSFMSDSAVTQVGPSALFAQGNPNHPQGTIQTGGLFINCTPSNPLLSAQENALLCNPANNLEVTPQGTLVDVTIGRRNIEGGPRTSDYEHKNFRGVFGLKGGWGDAWTYDVYGSFYDTSLFQSNGGYLSYTKAQDALLVVQGPNGPQCLSGNSGCVPYNIWTQGAVSAAQAASLATLGTAQGTVTERIFNANATGDLGKYGVQTPWAAHGLAVNFGAEHRSDALAYNPDSEELANDLAGFGGAGTAIDGAYHVQEEFIEARAPLIERRPGFEQLTLGAAYRHSNYSNAGGVNTYKFDVQYAPVADLLLRGSFDRAIRAPNIIELFTPQSVTNTSIVGSDPCAGAHPQATFAQCAFTGVTAAQYGHIFQCSAGQCSTLGGGNPNLTPETANTLSFGFTYQPAFLSGFSGSVDYYKIILKQGINTVPIDLVLNECLAGNTAFCSSVVRSPIGSLFGTTIAGGGYIKGTAVNISSAEIAGVDLQMGYRWNIGNWGTMSANLAGTWLQHSTTQPVPTEPTYDCAGLYGPTCQTVNPRWRHNLRVTWTTPLNVLLSAQWRYIGSTSLDTNTGNPQLIDPSVPYGPGVFDTFDARLPSVSYLDLTVSWDIWKNLNIRAGANNVLDKDPPLVSSILAGTGSANSYPTYDFVGRELFVAFTAKF